MITPLIMMVAYLIDYLLGEFKRFHPLVGFGWLTAKIEKTVNSLLNETESTNIWLPRLWGTFSWLVLCAPLPIIYYYFHQNNILFWCIDAVVLYFAVGLKSLKLHALQILKPLEESDLVTARHFCGYLVSRKTDNLSEQDISRATIESVLENGHDAAIASFFWFIIGGAPLVILHRLANTLDAMWGYKNQRFIHFGWCAARMDDILGWPSAKISALLYALQTNLSLPRTINALKNGHQQSQHYKSLNGGLVMATGASVLNFKLGGSAIYHGKEVISVTLGCGNNLVRNDISRSINLVNIAVITLIVISLSYEIILYFYGINLQ
jgi:adenosylcobinamide-phosphate synthase